MKIKDIINLVSALIKTDFTETGETELLVRLCNMVISEIASEHVPMETREAVLITNGRLYFKDLTQSPVDLKTLTNLHGERMRFRSYPTYIEAEDGEAILTYTFVPPYAEMEDEITLTRGKVSLRLLAYGVLAEYCLINGMYDEAKAYDQRFRSALVNAARKNVPMQIPKRTWK